MLIFLKSKLNRSFTPPTLKLRQTSRRAGLNRSFTLIELLIVIAILALLMSIIIITLNPSEMLKKSRDTKRISSLKALNNALGIFQATKPTTSMGTSSTVYISIPDSSSTCANLSLPTLPSGYTYSCSTSANYRKTDGTGWIPVNFDSLDIGSPISSLPIDPTNTTSTNLFFTYTTGGSWELNAILESSANKLSGDNDKTSLDGGDSYSTYEIGTDLSLSPYQDTGLVGYWKFDKYTSGSIAFNQTDGLADSSGYGYTTIAENTNGTGMAFVEGKRGGAVSFDGTDDYLRTNYDSHFDIGTGDYSISYWVYPRSMKHVYNLIGKAEYATGKGYMLRLNLNGSIENYIGDGSGSYWFSLRQASAYSANNWYHIVLSLDRDGSQNFYINGVIKRTQSIANSVDITESDSLTFGSILYGYMDEIRLYNKALSTAEVKALYEGTK